MDASSSQGREFEHVDLTGARFRKVRLGGARFRMVDLSGAVVRDASLSGASIDGVRIDGLRIDGVEVAPLVEAELVRRFPVRALRRASDPPGLRTAWSAIEQAWAASVDRASALPDDAVHAQVEDEWSYVQTLRHLVFATDAWLGVVQRTERPYHPWGLAFSDLDELVDGGAAALGVDPGAAPSFAEVLELRADRFARVHRFLADVTPDDLLEERQGPAWDRGSRVSVLACLRVILDEECEHLRFAERDLDVLEAVHREDG